MSTGDERNLVEQLAEIQLEWQLSPEQMASLLHVAPATYSAWIAAGSEQRRSLATIPPGMLAAVPIVSIRRNLGRKLADPAKQVEWLFRPHPDFGNHKPIDVIASSPDNQAWVSYYLESALARPAGA
jgi:hypothetical protein